MLDGDTCFVAIVKGESPTCEKYILIYADTPQGRRDALRALGRWAGNNELSFTWYDAAATSKRIRGEPADGSIGHKPGGNHNAGFDSQ